MHHVPLNQLSEHVAILPSPTTFTRKIVEEVFDGETLDVSVAIETNYLETIRMMVTIGLGWSVLPRSMLSDDLKILDVQGMRLYRTLGIVRHEEHSLSNAARAMMTSIMKYASPGCQKLG
jgi:DNA-binding transcriptional LysR family regulator